MTNCQEDEGQMVWMLVGAKRTLAITILQGKVDGGSSWEERHGMGNVCGWIRLRLNEMLTETEDRMAWTMCVGRVAPNSQRNSRRYIISSLSD